MSEDPRTNDFKPLAGAPVFKPWPKLPRLNRDIVITEKVDGTNAAIGIIDHDPTSVADGGAPVIEVYAQSRTRIITPEKDNFGFAAWVASKADLLIAALGPGLHFGEWYGKGIQRGYGLDERRFALFNTARYAPIPFAELGLPEVNAVPVLYEGPFGEKYIKAALEVLRQYGSNVGAKGDEPAEGIVVFHEAGGTMFKVTLEGDGEPKSVREARIAMEATA
jgi:hypothetical protein